MLERNTCFDFFPYTIGNAFENMAWDETLFRSVQNKKRKATFRLYGWKKDSISLGYFQSTQNLDIKRLKTKNISVVRRMTGGRAVYHEKELTYSLSVQLDEKTVSKKKFFFEEVSSLILAGLESLGLTCSLSGLGQDPSEPISKNKSNCFARTSFCEIVDQKGKKRVGMALLVQDSSLLAQGSIPLSEGYQKIEEFFYEPSSLSPTTSSSLLPSSLDKHSSLKKEDSISLNSKRFIESFVEAFVEGLSKKITLKESSLTQKEKECWKKQKEKYQDPKWTFQR